MGESRSDSNKPQKPFANLLTLNKKKLAGLLAKAIKVKNSSHNIQTMPLPEDPQLENSTESEEINSLGFCIENVRGQAEDLDPFREDDEVPEEVETPDEQDVLNVQGERGKVATKVDTTQFKHMFDLLSSLDEVEVPNLVASEKQPSSDEDLIIDTRDVQAVDRHKHGVVRKKKLHESSGKYHERKETSFKKNMTERRFGEVSRKENEKKRKEHRPSEQREEWNRPGSSGWRSEHEEKFGKKKPKEKNKERLEKDRDSSRKKKVDPHHKPEKVKTPGSSFRRNEYELEKKNHRRNEYELEKNKERLEKDRDSARKKKIDLHHKPQKVKSPESSFRRNEYELERKNHGERKSLSDKDPRSREKEKRKTEQKENKTLPVKTEPENKQSDTERELGNRIPIRKVKSPEKMKRFEHRHPKKDEIARRKSSGETPSSPITISSSSSATSLSSEEFGCESLNTGEISPVGIPPQEIAQKPVEKKTQEKPRAIVAPSKFSSATCASNTRDQSSDAAKKNSNKLPEKENRESNDKEMNGGKNKRRKSTEKPVTNVFQLEEEAQKKRLAQELPGHNWLENKIKSGDMSIKGPVYRRNSNHLPIFAPPQRSETRRPIAIARRPQQTFAVSNEGTSFASLSRRKSEEKKDDSSSPSNDQPRIPDKMSTGSLSMPTNDQPQTLDKKSPGSLSMPQTPDEKFNAKFTVPATTQTSPGVNTPSKAKSSDSSVKINFTAGTKFNLSLDVAPNQATPEAVQANRAEGMESVTLQDTVTVEKLVASKPVSEVTISIGTTTTRPKTQPPVTDSIKVIEIRSELPSQNDKQAKSSVNGVNSSSNVSMKAPTENISPSRPALSPIDGIANDVNPINEPLSDSEEIMIIDEVKNKPREYNVMNIKKEKGVLEQDEIIAHVPAPLTGMLDDEKSLEIEFQMYKSQVEVLDRIARTCTEERDKILDLKRSKEETLKIMEAYQRRYMSNPTNRSRKDSNKRESSESKECLPPKQVKVAERIRLPPEICCDATCAMAGQPPVYNPLPTYEHHMQHQQHQRNQMQHRNIPPKSLNVGHTTSHPTMHQMPPTTSHPGMMPYMMSQSHSMIRPNNAHPHYPSVPVTTHQMTQPTTLHQVDSSTKPQMDPRSINSRPYIHHMQTPLHMMSSMPPTVAHQVGTTANQPHVPGVIMQTPKPSVTYPADMRNYQQRSYLHHQLPQQPYGHQQYQPQSYPVPSRSRDERRNYLLEMQQQQQQLPYRSQTQTSPPKNLTTNNTSSRPVESPARNAANDTLVCNHCKGNAEFVCSLCQNVCYCSQDCQIANWDAHSSMCNSAR